ncbi:Ribonuclease [Armadillidium vulgare]|nr:Ribonuclease [Armadillidium vulgare]
MSSKIIRKVISTSKAPAAIGPYSQAVQAGNLLFISGQLGFDPKTMTIVPGGVVPETEQVLNNIKSILDEAGCTLKNVAVLELVGVIVTLFKLQY